MATATTNNVTQIKPNAKIRPNTEYTTGSTWFTNQPHALPTIDEKFFSRDRVTEKTIQEMLHDPDVYAAVMLIVLMTLSEKLTLKPALQLEAEDYEKAAPAQTAALPPSDAQTSNTPKDNVPATGAAPNTGKPATGQPDTENNPAEPKLDPQVQMAQDVADFCERQICRVPKFSLAMFQLVFEGLVYGNKVAEQVLEVAQGGVDADKWCLKAVKPKPRHALAFVVDPFMNQLGFLVAEPGKTNIVNATTIVDMSQVIPREKFVVFTYRPHDDDPRGNTILDAALNGWDLKRRTWPEYLLFLMVSAVPGIIATLAANSDEQVVYEADGITPVMKDGEPLKISAAQFLLNLLAKMRNHQVAVAPEGTAFTLLEANTEGQAFTTALDHFSKEITLAILMQQLATKDSQHQSKGSTASQFRIVDLLVFWVRELAADMVRYDILKPLVRYNFGDDAANELLPEVSYGDVEARDWATDATAMSSLAVNLTPSQWDYCTSTLGIPLPTNAERSFRAMSKQLSQQMQQASLTSLSDPNKPAQEGNTKDKPGADAKKDNG
jgi:hypothetical protein